MVFLARLLSENPARIIGLYPQKGSLKPGSDADVVVLREGVKKESVVPSLADVYNPYESVASHLKIEAVFLKGALQVLKGNRVKPDEAKGEVWQRL